MKKKKIGLMFLAITVQFFGFSLSASADGCCIKDSSKTVVDPSNCEKNVASMAACTGAKPVFLNGDPGCDGAISKSYCSSSFDPIGCCIVETADSSKFGPNNCLSNKKRSECGGANSRHDVLSGNCSDLSERTASIACKSNANSVAGNLGGDVTTDFANPLKFKTVEEVTTALLDNLRGILATIAVVFIVIGGIMYMLSAGNEKMMERAKATWTAAVIGLAIALAAPSFLKEIMIILQADTSPVAGALTIKDIALRVLNLLLSLIGIFGILGLVIGGGFYLTAYGDEDRIDKGKKIITASVIGIVVAFGALVIVRQVASLLGAA